jgi:hypothetical protein
VRDSDDAKTEVTGVFTESTEAAGLYFTPNIVINEPGDYTVVMNNPSIGMTNHPHPVVVTNATIDDVNNAIAAVQATANDIKTEVDGLDGQNLQDIKASLASIKALLDDEDGNAVNSVMEFVQKIDDALSSGASSLSVLSGYTDDIENMLLGTEHLADGSDNPLYGANNADLMALVQNSLAALQNNIAVAKNSIEVKINDFKASVESKVDAVKTVVDANAAILGDNSYGNSALKGLLDNITAKIDSLSASTSIADARDAVLAVLNDNSTGLAAIKNYIAGRFDNVDSNLASIESKIDAITNAQDFTVLI